MTILYPTTRPVNTRRSFGLGLTRDNTTPKPASYSDADWRWYCERVADRSGGIVVDDRLDREVGSTP